MTGEPRVTDGEEERDDAVIGQALVWSGIILTGAATIGMVAAAVWLLRPAAKFEPAAPAVAPEIRETAGVEVPSLPFTDITESAGLRWKFENGAAGEKLLPETMGGGVAFLDFDSDGDADILLVNSSRWPWDERPAPAEPPTIGLFRNDGLGNFTDATQEAGLAVTFYGQGVAVGDYDNDGDPDLFFSAVGTNHLFRNDGGKYVEVTGDAGLAGDPAQWSTSCGWFDYDRDGDLDLFVVNYVMWTREFDVAQHFQLTGGGRAYGRPQNFPGTFPYLYRNDGGGKFTEVGEAAGLHVKNPSTGVPAGKSLGVTFADFDADGWMDVMVANDTVQNFLFHNRKNGTFEECATLCGVAFDNDGNARGAMGLDTAHFRNSAAIGIAIGNFSNEMSALYVASEPTLQFTDEAISTGLGPQTRLELTFGTMFCDLDLDGRLDLVSANGHLEEEINKVQPSQFYEQPPHLFWNCGPEQATEFVPIPRNKTTEDVYRRMVGRGAAFADIDGDGDLDLLFGSSGGAPRLLRNDQQLGHHWLRVKLRGATCNRDAIGAQLELQLADRKEFAQVMPTRSYLSQVEPTVTFGLGAADRIERLRIVWPDGRTSLHTDLPPNRQVEIVQPVEAPPAAAR